MQLQYSNKNVFDTQTKQTILFEHGECQDIFNEPQDKYIPTVISFILIIILNQYHFHMELTFRGLSLGYTDLMT